MRTCFKVSGKVIIVPCFRKSSLQSIFPHLTSETISQQGVKMSVFQNLKIKWQEQSTPMSYVRIKSWVHVKLVNKAFRTISSFMRKVFSRCETLFKDNVLTRQVSSMIPSARLTIPPVTVANLTWNLICFARFWNVGMDGRTDRQTDRRTDKRHVWK